MGKYTVLVEWDEESAVFVTHVPTLGNISTYGDTEAEALAATKELIEGYLEAAEKEHIKPSQRIKLVELAVG